MVELDKEELNIVGGNLITPLASIRMINFIIQNYIRFRLK